MITEREVIKEVRRAVTKVRAGVSSVARAGEECLSLILADGFECAQASYCDGDADPFMPPGVMRTGSAFERDTFQFYEAPNLGPAPYDPPDLADAIVALNERLEASEDPTRDLTAGQADLAPGQEKAP